MFNFLFTKKEDRPSLNEKVPLSPCAKNGTLISWDTDVRDAIRTRRILVILYMLERINSYFDCVLPSSNNSGFVFWILMLLNVANQFITMSSRDPEFARSIFSRAFFNLKVRYIFVIFFVFELYLFLNYS